MHFVGARVLRIMPALLAVVLMTAFVIGPLASELPWRSYSRRPIQTATCVQALLFFGGADTLPGVFAAHPLPTINGSIWTLRYGAECYGLVFLLGISGLLRKELTLALYLMSLTALGTQDAAPLEPLSSS